MHPSFQVLHCSQESLNTQPPFRPESCRKQYITAAPLQLHKMTWYINTRLLCEICRIVILCRTVSVCVLVVTDSPQVCWQDNPISFPQQQVSLILTVLTYSLTPLCN